MSEKIPDHIAALILDMAADRSGQLTFFESDLSNQIRENFKLLVSPEDCRSACEILVQSGAAKKLESPLTSDIYNVKNSDLFDYFEDQAGPGEHTSMDYDRLWKSANENFPILKTYYFGTGDWVSRVVAAMKAQGFGGDVEAEEASPDSNTVPASDRVVSLNHNQSEDLAGQANELIDQVSKLNAIEGEDGLQQIILGQLKAGRELINQGFFRLYVLEVTLINALTFLVKRYEHEVIGALASALLTALAIHLGLSQ